QAQLVRDHLKASLDYQAKLARFLENHDEPRAAASFPWEVHQAAAAITYLTPGLRFFHQGQLEGRRKRISPHLVRGPDEPCDEAIAAFYSQLFNALRTPIVREGDWSLLDCTPAWDGNDTHDCFIVFAWRGANGATRIVAVNFAAHQSQCHARLPFADLAGRTWRIQDQLRDAHYDWRGEDLLGKGLYLDMPAWQACVYDLIG
ncbi:MAG TPA: alpha-amylase, partial [Pirellulales bacterium]